MKQATARQTALDDAMALIESLELPYLEALQQRLAAHIDQRRVLLRRDALAEIQRIAASVGMDVAQLMNVPSKARGSMPVKYRHPDGRSWSGQGRLPSWIKDGEREAYRV